MLEEKEEVSVLFVCMANICRSPTAEGVFRHVVNEAGLAERFEIDSAGTHAYHTGEPPDRRAVAAAEKRGVSLKDIAARRVADIDFEQFDYVIAMDEDNQQRLLDQSPQEHQSKIHLFLSFSADDEIEVPDPYYGGAKGFERVLDLIEKASKDLLKSIDAR
jgi:protein-tyrosine phosphatase